MFACAQPAAGLQESFVQPLPSLQFNVDPPHVPPAQVSFVVQALPSSQGSELFACVQPVAESQASVVQRLPSLQLGADPPTQLSPEQVSLVVQAFPSSQGSLLFVKMQPLP